jgi:hypothetical protein
MSEKISFTDYKNFSNSILSEILKKNFGFRLDLLTQFCSITKVDFKLTSDRNYQADRIF